MQQSNTNKSHYIETLKEEIYSYAETKVSE